MENLLKWVPTRGSKIPDNAVLGGQEADGRPLFVARAIHNGYWCPGKAGYHLKGCHTGSDWIEKEYDKYDVLTIPPEAECCLTWKRDSFGHLPHNAVSVCPSSPLYIGRHPHAGSLDVGKIDIRNKAIYVTYGGREHQYYNYDVLVYNPQQPSRYSLHNVIYDLISAQVHTDNDLSELTSKHIPWSTIQENHFSVPYLKKSSHQWNIHSDVKHGTQVKVIAGIPWFIESKFKTSPPKYISHVYGQFFKDESKAFLEATLTSVPKLHNRVSVVAYQQDIYVPYTASLTQIMDDGKEVTTQTSGMYHCITHTDYQTTTCR